LLIQELGADTWCSVIASMSTGGEDNERFYLAKDFHQSVGRMQLQAAPFDAHPEAPSLLIQHAEEHLCTCGAGHGSLEGHVEWCEWLRSEWCMWGSAVNSATGSKP
jgi:hypothetical protein